MDKCDEYRQLLEEVQAFGFEDYLLNNDGPEYWWCTCCGVKGDYSGKDSIKHTADCLRTRIKNLLEKYG